MITDANGREIAPDQTDFAPVPERHGERGILGLCWRCGAGVTETDAAAGSCTQCGAAMTIRRPCPQCGGRTEKASGTIAEWTVRTGEAPRRVGRPATWDQCTRCEWAEERR